MLRGLKHYSSLSSVHMHMYCVKRKREGGREVGREALSQASNGMKKKLESLQTKKLFTYTPGGGGREGQDSRHYIYMLPKSCTFVTTATTPLRQVM